jgi:hypothetical protein
LNFSPWIPLILTRVAGDGFMPQPGSCLPEPLDQLLANTSKNITQRLGVAPTPWA